MPDCQPQAHVGSHGRQMHREIVEQPEAIRATIAVETEAIGELVAELRQSETQHVLIVARGTSDNAALYGLYMLGSVTQKLAATACPSLLTCYDADIDLRDTLVLGVSQSGEATDVIEVLEAAAKRGAITCALTNVAGSPICGISKHTLLTHAEEERSVAATKTYTTALAILHQLASRWADRQDIVDQIHQVPDWLTETLRLEPQIADRGERFRFMESCHWLARGLNFCTAKEAALKMAECCYVVPSAMSTADFMHGPIATTEPGFPCFVVAPKGKALSAVSVVVEALREREAELIIISNDEAALSRGHIAIELPDMPEECSPIAAAVVGQLLALHIARDKGLDPDHPRGLRKVTLTL